MLITKFNQFIKEARGFSQISEDWAYIITDYIMESIFDIEGEEPLTMIKLSKKYSNKQFFKKLPIESIIINVFVERIDGEEGGADASYVPLYSHLENDVVSGIEVIEDVEFNLDIEIPKTATKEGDYNAIRNYLFEMFSHEVLHVYEWYNRDLEDPAERKDCMGLFTGGDLNGNLVDRIAYLIYTQLSFEVNAFVHQTGTILRKRDINSYEDFMRELKSLFIWNFVEGLLDFNADEALKEIDSLSTEDKQLLLQMKLCYYSTKDEEGESQVDTRIFTLSTEKFLKDLEKRFQRRGNLMKKKLYRLSSDLI